MKYRFGALKPRFTGDNMEWNQLKLVVSYWNEETSNYPNVTVICPHCGVKNTYLLSKHDKHYDCKLMLNRKGQPIFYNCPGFHIRKIS
jgi:hypothetical protein